LKKKIVLIDNGSLAPASVLRLRAIAERLSDKIGERVDPVSMAHSDKIEAEALGGERALLWKDYLEKARTSAPIDFVVLPLFFGPSRAVVRTLPAQFEAGIEAGDSSRLRVAETLVRHLDPNDDAIAKIASELIIQKLNTLAEGDVLPLVLVDHGSPNPKVGECRGLVAEQLTQILGERVESVSASSMERRIGESYDFNEPLLEKLLDRGLDTEANTLCLSLMFLSPGRHAGEGGDIANIVGESRWVKDGKSVIQTDLIGQSDALIDLLVERYRSVIEH